MTYLTLLFSVATLWAFSVVSPGPNFLMTARLSIARSRREGLQAVAGVVIGTAIWGAAGCLGVQALFVAAPWAYLGLKIAGAAYLIVMGCQMLWQSVRHTRSDHFDVAGPGLKLSPFKLGLLTTLANPRSAVSVASIFATTMPPSPSLLLSLSVVALMAAISAGWYVCVVYLFSFRYLADGYRRFRRWIERVSGSLLVFFGVNLAVER